MPAGPVVGSHVGGNHPTGFIYVKLDPQNWGFLR